MNATISIPSTKVSELDTIYEEESIWEETVVDYDESAKIFNSDTSSSLSTVKFEDSQKNSSLLKKVWKSWLKSKIICQKTQNEK